MALLSLLCLAGAATLALWPDPWARADEKGASDTAMLAELIEMPDKISWRLTEDVSLLRAIAWGADARRRYPPPGGMLPLPYELSDAAIRDLTATHAQTDDAAWTRFDLVGLELLHCNATPAICIVYDRALLEEALGLPPDALTSERRSNAIPVLLLALAAVCAAAAFGFRKTQAPNSPPFTLVPERHIAIRDTLEVALTPRDLKLLSFLAERDGAVVTKDELYDVGWGRDYMPNSRALDQHIINLRRKLDPDKSRPVLIETVHGVGYRLIR